VFKWSCFAVAVVFLAATGWMLNDIRLEVRHAGELVRATGDTVKEHLPTIVEKSKQTTAVLAAQLPEIVGKVKTTTDTLATLANDISQVRKLLVGDRKPKAGEHLLEYANSVLDKIDEASGTIGLKPLIPGKGPTNPGSVQEWVVRARREALGLAVLGVTRKQMAIELARNWFKASWYIQFKGEKTVPLLDWLKANHPPTRELWSNEK
jgi:hypothetical protein